MKAMAIRKYGKQEKLHLIEAPMPTAGDDEILVEIHAASVNPIDYKIRDGKARVLMSFPFPLILGHDFAGRVIGTGSKATRFKPGDLVFGRPRRENIGTLAEYITVHESEVALMPENLTMEEAAGIPLVGLTSWQTLHDVVRLQQGHKILIHAGAGGVGSFAIQLARHMGAYVAATASESGFALVRSLGADEVIDYRKERFEQKLRQYDSVFDTIGGDTLIRSFQIVKPGGIVASLSGMPDRRFAIQENLGPARTLLFSMLSRKLTALARRHQAEYRYSFMRPNGQHLQIIAILIESGKIRPVVDRVYAFDEAQTAIEYLQRGHAKGKVIVKIR